MVAQNKRSKLFLFIAVVVAAFLWAASFTSVFAIADPDSIAIEDVRAYDSVLESGDLLIIVEYNLPYTALPDEIIFDAYLGRFLLDTTELKSVEPFAFNDKGYGRGIFSLYWTKVQKEADSIEFDNPNAEAYKLILQGKVGVFTGSVPTITSNSISWTDTARTATLLFQEIERIARKFENDTGWNDDADFADLIENPGGTVQLTSTGIGSGEEYFSNAVPQLGAMIPSIFSSSQTSPDVSERPDSRSFADEKDQFWNGNWIDEKFDFLALQHQAPKRTFTAMFAVIFMGLIAFFCANLLGQNALAVPFGMLTMAFTFPMFGAINFFPLNFVLATSFVMGVLGLGWVFFLRKT